MKAAAEERRIKVEAEDRRMKTEGRKMEAEEGKIKVEKMREVDKDIELLGLYPGEHTFWLASKVPRVGYVCPSIRTEKI